MRLLQPLPPPAGNGAGAGLECGCKPPEFRGSTRPAAATADEQKNSRPQLPRAAGSAPSCTTAIAEVELPAMPEARPPESPAGLPAIATTATQENRDAPALAADESPPDVPRAARTTQALWPECRTR